MFKITGIPELKAALAKLPRSVDTAAASSAARSAAAIQARAKALVSKRSGATEKAIVVKTATKGQKISASVTIEASPELVKDGVFYPAVLEFGSSKRAAVPFLRPALEQKRDSAIGDMGSEIKQAVE